MLAQPLVKLSLRDDVRIVVATALRVDTDEGHRVVVSSDSSSFERRVLLVEVIFDF